MLMHPCCCSLYFVLLEFAQSSKRFKSLLKMLLENEKEKSPLSPSLGFWPERPSSLNSFSPSFSACWPSCRSALLCRPSRPSFLHLGRLAPLASSCGPAKLVEGPARRPRSFSL